MALCQQLVLYMPISKSESSILTHNPLQIVLGTKLKPQGKGVKRRLVEKEECMVYIPLLETLSILLNEDMVLSEV